MNNKEERRKEHYKKATGKPYDKTNVEKGRLFEQVKKFSPHLLVNPKCTALTSKSDFTNLDFWEVIIPIRGQLGYGGDLPLYFEQGNCDILTNKSGLLIQKEVFLEFLENTNIFHDFTQFYFFDAPDSSEMRYQTKYPIQEIETMQSVGVNQILVKKDYE